MNKINPITLPLLILKKWNILYEKELMKEEPYKEIKN